MLLAAIRDYLKGKNEPVLVESLNNDFLTGIARSQRARIPRLRLNVDDNDLFKAIVAAEEPFDPAGVVLTVDLTNCSWARTGRPRST